MASTTFNFTVGHNTGAVIVAGNIVINWHTDGNTLWFDSASLNSGYSWYNAQKLAIVVNGAEHVLLNQPRGYSGTKQDAINALNSGLPFSVGGLTYASFVVRFGDAYYSNTYLQPYGDLAYAGGDNPNGIVLATPPNISGANVWANNPAPYRLNAGISGMNWGTGYAWRNLVCNIRYSIDGVSYNYNAGQWSDGGDKTVNLNGNTSNPAKPWAAVPDGETVTVTWTASTNIGSSSKSVDCWCQLAYNAYVIDSVVNGGKPVEADLFVSNVAGQAPNKQIRRIATVQD